MKYLYTFLLFIISSNLISAQLSVRNDNYVFISDEIVFVEDDINLNEADSRIYLRSDAQVIQGTGTTGNSGVGELSVYQEGDHVGPYHYNYWCSPIGDKTSSSTNNPFGVTLLNDVTGLITSTPATVSHQSDYNGISSPLTIEQYWIWKYIANTAYAAWVHVQGATTINPGEGYTMKGTSGSGSSQRYDFRGKPNNGTIGVTVAANEFTLVGNPYPSALDALAYIHDTDNQAAITGTLYYWEQDMTINSHYIADYEGGYATYTISAGGVPTYVPPTFSTYDQSGNPNGSGSGSPYKTPPQRYIPIGQGFMVEGRTGTTGTVRAKNSHRIFVQEGAGDGTNGSIFFKTSNTKSKTSSESKTNNGYSIMPDDHKRFRLNIDFNDTYTRQLVETFHSSATSGFDYGLESEIYVTDILASDAYLSNNESTYLAEALPFEETLKIPLTINVANDMPIRIRIADVQHFDSQSIYIHDIENDTYVDLTKGDFNANLLTGNYTDRFEITFQSSNNNGLLDVDEEVLNSFKVFQNNNIAELKIYNPNALQVKDFNLFDINGKLVLRDNIESAKKQYTYSTKSLSDGVYVAKINLDNNQIISKKVVVANNK